MDCRYYYRGEKIPSLAGGANHIIKESQLNICIFARLIQAAT